MPAGACYQLIVFNYKAVDICNALLGGMKLFSSDRGARNDQRTLGSKKIDNASGRFKTNI
jgi:hypothetical protein